MTETEGETERERNPPNDRTGLGGSQESTPFWSPAWIAGAGALRTSSTAFPSHISNEQSQKKDS